jgi:hypothetical protein
MGTGVHGDGRGGFLTSTRWTGRTPDGRRATVEQIEGGSELGFGAERRLGACA